MTKFRKLYRALRFLYKYYVKNLDLSNYAYIGKNVDLHPPLIVTNPKNVYLYDNTNIFGFSYLIIDKQGKFIMKKNSGAAQGLTVVTANHSIKPTIGKWHKVVIQDASTDHPKDVIVEEDVWIAANVTLLPGVTVGRGSIVGAGSVCRYSIPPYSIVMGNPAKVIGFKFTPEEIINHEEVLYSSEERISYQTLKRNYQKYYLNRIKEITQFIKK